MDYDLIFESLQKAATEGYLVSVFWNRNTPNKCSCGFVEEISDQFVSFQHISVDGFYDGYKVHRLEDVYRVDKNGKYEKNLLFLYKSRQQFHIGLVKGKVNHESNYFIEALKQAKDQKMVVSVCIDETEDQDDIVGWVKSVDNKSALISLISASGEDDGESCFYIEDIVRVDCDTEDESVLGLLNQRNL